MVKRWILLNAIVLLSTCLNAVRLERVESTEDNIRRVREFSGALQDSNYTSISNSNDYSELSKCHPTINDCHVISIIRTPANTFSGVYFAFNDRKETIGRFVVSNYPISFSFNQNTEYAVEFLVDFKPCATLSERGEAIEHMKKIFSKSILNKSTNFFEQPLDAKRPSNTEVIAIPKYLAYFPDLYIDGVNATAFLAQGFTMIDMKNQEDKTHFPMLWPSNNFIEIYTKNNPMLNEINKKLFMFTGSKPEFYTSRQQRLTEYLQNQNQLKKSDSMSSLSEDTSDEECCCGDLCSLQ